MNLLQKVFVVSGAAYGTYTKDWKNNNLSNTYFDTLKGAFAAKCIIDFSYVITIGPRLLIHRVVEGEFSSLLAENSPLLLLGRTKDLFVGHSSIFTLGFLGLLYAHHKIQIVDYNTSLYLSAFAVVAFGFLYSLIEEYGQALMAGTIIGLTLLYFLLFFKEKSVDNFLSKVMLTVGTMIFHCSSIFNFGYTSLLLIPFGFIILHRPKLWDKFLSITQKKEKDLVDSKVLYSNDRLHPMEFPVHRNVSIDNNQSSLPKDHFKFDFSIPNVSKDNSYEGEVKVQWLVHEDFVKWMEIIVKNDMSVDDNQSSLPKDHFEFNFSIPNVSKDNYHDGETKLEAWKIGRFKEWIEKFLSAQPSGQDCLDFGLKIFQEKIKYSNSVLLSDVLGSNALDKSVAAIIARRFDDQKFKAKTDPLCKKVFEVACQKIEKLTGKMFEKFSIEIDGKSHEVTHESIPNLLDKNLRKQELCNFAFIIFKNVIDLNGTIDFDNTFIKNMIDKIVMDSILSFVIQKPIPANNDKSDAPKNDFFDEVMQEIIKFGSGKVRTISASRCPYKELSPKGIENFLSSFSKQNSINFVEKVLEAKIDNTVHLSPLGHALKAIIDVRKQDPIFKELIDAYIFSIYEEKFCEQINLLIGEGPCKLTKTEIASFLSKNRKKSEIIEFGLKITRALCINKQSKWYLKKVTDFGLSVVAKALSFRHIRQGVEKCMLDKMIRNQIYAFINNHDC